MKKIIAIILLSLLTKMDGISGDKFIILENIIISNQNKFARITLIFNKQFEFTSQKKGETIEISLSNIQFSENFPGSELEVKSGYLKSINFSRENNAKVITKILTTNVNDYSIYPYKDSKTLVIEIYNPLELSPADLKFRNGLKLFRNGQPEAALREFRKLSSENYNNPEMFFQAGLIRESLGYMYQAKANLSNAKVMGLDNPDLYARLSDIYEKLDQKDNSVMEQKKFISEYDKLKKSTLDTSITFISKSIKPLLTTDSLMLAQNANDSMKQANASKSNLMKPSETRIVKSEPINNDSYWYAIISNIVVVLVAGACIFSVWLLVRKKSNKKEKVKKEKTKKLKEVKTSGVTNKVKPVFEGINLLNNEIATPIAYKKASFNNFLNEYKKNEPKENTTVENKTNEPKLKTKEELPKMDGILDFVEIKKPDIQVNDIEKLAKKYHVEQDKVELALKLMSKNDFEPVDDKYKVLNEMLKQNKSIEELARQLRIPKGEIDLISSLNEL